MVAYEKQGHECVICYEEFKFNQVYVDILFYGSTVAKRRLITEI